MNASAEAKHSISTMADSTSKFSIDPTGSEFQLALSIVRLEKENKELKEALVNASYNLSSLESSSEFKVLASRL
jgi:hypothetical protein